MYLSDEHTDLLYEIAEIHFQCFEKFYPEYGITYDLVLKLNHTKMLDLMKVCDGDKLNEIFNDILKEYKEILTSEQDDGSNDF